MVHANWLFCSGFHLVLKPLLGLVSSKSDKIHLLSDAKGEGNAHLSVSMGDCLTCLIHTKFYSHLLPSLPILSATYLL